MRLPSALADAIEEQYAAEDATIEGLRYGDPATINRVIVDLQRANAKRLRLIDEQTPGGA